LKKDSKLIYTLGERCKVCYTCVRDCPAKAIRISNGQAEVINDRCIGCGNCVRVCSQNAKQYYDSQGEVDEILESDATKVAIVAPSFPAEFHDIPPDKLTGMLRKLGFDLVCEVAFGADIVAAKYRQLIKDDPEKRYIATTCPGIVTYIEKYHPTLVKHLAPVASPMIATARALRILHSQQKLKIVFIGPCIAKKAEAARSGNGDPDVNAVLTFSELRSMFRKHRVTPEKSTPGLFDPPHPGLGALFALSGGMLQAANMKEDLLSCDIVAADGKNNFVQALKEFEEGAFHSKLLEILCCNGCIMGSGIQNDLPYFSRRTAVTNYVNDKIKKTNKKDIDQSNKELDDKLDLEVNFKVDDHRLPLPSKEEIDAILKNMGKFKPEDELDCAACGYPTCRDHAIAIHKGLAENEMCLPNTIERLKKSLEDLNDSNHKLANTRQALINAEKLASMGQLSAGIAHEINNPLGVILLYANLLLDETPEDTEGYEDLKMISEQAERCKNIVSGLLNFARKNKVILQPTNIQELIDHCLKAIIPPPKVEIVVEHKLRNPIAEVDADQIIQVLTNLIVNAIEAMPPEEGGKVSIAAYDNKDDVKIIVKDDGIGIAPEHRNKIFEPLFTTKQMGKGTGLGLAVTYGIIKMHRGQINLESNNDPNIGPTETTFTVTLPRKGKDN
jgi:iron only hydrogenase large subunit-like protein/nitrogen-specific signal transduction histidine kinase